MCDVMCVYYSVRRIFFPRLADRTNLLSDLFFCYLFFSADLSNVGSVFHNYSCRMFFEADRCYLNQPMHLFVNLHTWTTYIHTLFRYVSVLL